MSKKTYMLINGLTIGIGTIAATVVAFLNPRFEPEIIASIEVIEGTITTICAKFIIDDVSK